MLVDSVIRLVYRINSLFTNSFFSLTSRCINHPFRLSGIGSGRWKVKLTHFIRVTKSTIAISGLRTVKSL